MSNEEYIRQRLQQQRQLDEDNGDNQRLRQHQQQLGRKRENGNDDKKSTEVSLQKVIIAASVISVILLVIVYILFIPEKSYPVVYSLPDPPALEGSLSANSFLSSAEKLFEGKIEGPETIVHQKGHFYTGTADGRILHIHNSVIQTVARLGKEHCDGSNYLAEPACGRPLGMKFDPDGYLVVIEPYSGLYRVNVATGDVHLLLPSGVMIDGRPLNFLNSLDIASDGNIYVTDSSTYQRRDFVMDLLDGRPTGRLLRYDPVRNSTEILLDGLRFANGVQLSRYEDFVLVCETFAARIMKYNIKGIKAGRAEVFVENLPGLPDNIKSSSSGGFWVAMPTVRFQGMKISVLDFLASRTFTRFLLSKLYGVISLDSFSPSHGTMVVELNGKGEIVRTLMDLEGKNLQGISEVEDVVGVLYFGSFRSSYMARLDSSRL